MSVINQKEYLKKYLNIGGDKDKSKKKKKRSKIITDRVKIIDDDLDTSNIDTLTKNELDEFLTAEDAPQVVGVIDDRPLALRLDDYRKNSKWKLVGSDDEQNELQVEPKSNDVKKVEKSCQGKLKSAGYDSDLSPARTKKRDSDSDMSPTRKESKYQRSNSNPDRKKMDNQNRNSAQKREYKHNDDYNAGPLRKSRTHRDAELSPRRKNDESISSKSNSDRKSNLSPPRKEYIPNKNSESDESPIRKSSSKRVSSPHMNNINRRINSSPTNKYYLPSQNSDSDTSLPRKSNKVDQKCNNQRKRSRWGEASPPIFEYKNVLDQSSQDNNHTNADFDSNPIRRPYKDHNKFDKYSSKERNSEDISRKSDYDKKKYEKDRRNANASWDSENYQQRNKFSTSASEQSSSNKMKKTLDGKTAGLQNARDLKHETVAFKKREEDLFKKMTEEVSGINAAPIMRDRKTGKKRDFEKEAMDEFSKKKKEDEQKAKYNQWGKGLKQVSDLKETIEQNLHEMSKPLARYADDEDLEAYLKDQERDGDPMLQYMRKKKRKNAVEAGKPVKPVYDGEFMPNRFSIPPGHRWDGVDRSNGYEKSWFEKQNAKKAVEEEIYKWSTEDM